MSLIAIHPQAGRDDENESKPSEAKCSEGFGTSG